MDLGVKGHLFLVLGASSGLGKAVAVALMAEGAEVLGVARRQEELDTLSKYHPQFEALVADVTEPNSIEVLRVKIRDRPLSGILVNAGGPPAKQTLETTLEDWDNAYQSLLRWKVELMHAFVPLMILNGYGRIVFIESASVKQPIQNLVLSNSLRVAVVNMAKTLSQEIAGTGVTLNILAPGSHDTAAIGRVYKKKSQQTGLPEEEVKAQAISSSPMKTLGNAEDFASLASWLLSPHSRYISGQTISVDGGTISGIFG